MASFPQSSASCVCFHGTSRCFQGEGQRAGNTAQMLVGSCRMQLKDQCRRPASCSRRPYLTSDCSGECCGICCKISTSEAEPGRSSSIRSPSLTGTLPQNLGGQHWRNGTRIRPVAYACTRTHMDGHSGTLTEFPYCAVMFQ